VTLAWSATQDAAATGARGDVVWSASRQEGYMRFSGLAANDPAVSQYQLWVFDRERDERYPVDGGVFDIPAGGAEVVVPIDTRVPVASATLFAVTVETPGGVVVSSRERIALVAQPAGS
jgi:anti-sigma-K factor RskA